MVEMRGLAGRIAPTLAVGLVVAYCCFPYLAGAHRQYSESSKLPEIGDQLLSPQTSPFCQRNPFGLAVLAEAVRNLDLSPGAQGEPEVTHGDNQSLVDPAELIGTLKLQGTFIQGQRRIAVIDGRTYEQGQTLEAAEGGGEPLVLDQVFQHGVTVRHKQRRYQLTYGAPSDASIVSVSAPMAGHIPNLSDSTPARALTHAFRALLNSGG
jgi:hypothetical protein